LFVLVICAMLGVYVDRVQRQQAAIAAIEKSGGRALYDDQIKNGPSDTLAERWSPAWLRQKLGDDYFHPIVMVSMSSLGISGQRQQASAADELLSHLDGLPRLEFLDIQEIQASDKGLAHVGKLGELRRLFMRDARNVTDAGVSHLAGCRRLEELDLRGGSQISDEGLRVLSRWPRLKLLCLSDSRCTDRGLAHVGQMRQLTSLNLDYAVVTDDGLTFLAKLTALESLSLQDAQVTNAGLKHLRGLKNLRSLDLRGTSVTDISELRATLPDCLIHSNQPSS
jgi:hypothetical protein